MLVLYTVPKGIGKARAPACRVPFGTVWQAQPPAKAKIYWPFVTSSLLSVCAAARGEKTTFNPTTMTKKIISERSTVEIPMTLACALLAKLIIQVLEQNVKCLIDRRCLTGLLQDICHN